MNQMFLGFFNSFSTSKCFVLFEVTLSLIFLNLASKSVCFTKLLTSGILFSTAVNAELVARQVILGILPSISVILAFMCFFASSLVSGIFLSASLIFFSKSDLSVSYAVFKANPVVSTLFTLATNFSYTDFLTTSHFTTLLSFAKSLGTGVNLSIFSLSTSVFKLA